MPGGDRTRTAAGRSGLPEMIGDFRVVRKIGEGGMGIVYEAEQQHPRRSVALKVIRGGRYVDDSQVRLFKREAQALARLRHPAIAAIYESGRTEDGQHFFAMELVRGETLAAHMTRKHAAAGLAPFDIKDALGLFWKLCEAVSYAHQRGVIHRDLKPANILVLPDASQARPGSTSPAVPDLKILDFGLARITEADVAVSTVATELGRVAGSPPLHEPRAGAREPRRDRPQKRRLLARGHPLRAPDRAAAA